MGKDVTAEPKYDVAISFLKQHLALAEQIRDELADRLTTFVYSKEQPELVGRDKDGVDGFTRVFRRDSRVCVVLHSEGWGAQGMTFIEESAMKERALSPGQGWEFLIVVCLDKTAPPDWIPKQKIWWGYEEYGLQGLLAAIDIKVTELGGRPKQNSVLEKAARRERERDFEERKRLFGGSEAGVKAAHAEVTRLYEVLETKVQEFAEAVPSLGVTFAKNSSRWRSAAAISSQASFVLYWQPQFENTLRDAALLIIEWGGGFNYSGVFGGPPKLAEYFVTPTIDYAGHVVWQGNKSEAPLTSEKFVDFLFERLVDNQDAEPPNEPQRIFPHRPRRSNWVYAWRDQ